MPARFKNRITGTDAENMSDVVDDQITAFMLDGELPRLGSVGSPAPAVPSQPVIAPATAPSVFDVVAAPALAAPTFAAPQVGAPTVDTPGVPMMPMMPALPSLPTLPTKSIEAPASTIDTNTDTATDSGEPAAPARHPMAHLMPEKSMPSEASRRAAEARAAKKAKAKKIKLIAAACFLAFAVLVGPLVYKFFSDGLAQAGKTTPDEPAPAATVAPEPTDAPISVAPGLTGAIDAAKDAVSATDDQATVTP